MSKIFFVCDTETTGFSPKNADVIEIAALKVETTRDGFKVLDAVDIYVNPGYPLPAAIVEFNEKNGTGINDAFLKENGVSKKEAAMQMDAFFGENPTVVGHNFQKFDLGFVNKLFMDGIRKPFSPKKVTDTLLLHRKYEPDIPSHKLADCFEMTEKKYSSMQPKFHTAIADCYATLDVLDDIVKHHAPKLNKNPQLELR